MPVVKFENIDPPGAGSTSIPNGYAGLQWNNFYTYDTADFTGGWEAGTHSGTSVGFNGGGDNASFSSEGTFSLKSGYFTAANLEFVDVRIVAYLDGVKVGSKKFEANDAAQTFIKFGSKFDHIDEVRISTYDVSQSQLAIDDLRVTFDDPFRHDSGHDAGVDRSAAHAALTQELNLLGANAHAHTTDTWMLC